MQLSRIHVDNFRGIANGDAFFEGHTVFAGANNLGKSTLLEAEDLVICPERIANH